ncbi:unnamed protein product [Paramecium sonneborni]|uniref:Uncharacterized protein n=1 Tax=Paramecium sonneborni TaxID=65129 RepID=A0A8S1KHA7_9CILI|nr:unnamed protein product [Paramecium sonneborni]
MTKNITKLYSIQPRLPEIHTQLFDILTQILHSLELQLCSWLQTIHPKNLPTLPNYHNNYSILIQK